MSHLPRVKSGQACPLLTRGEADYQRGARGRPMLQMTLGRSWFDCHFILARSSNSPTKTVLQNGRLIGDHYVLLNAFTENQRPFGVISPARQHCLVSVGGLPSHRCVSIRKLDHYRDGIWVILRVKLSPYTSRSATLITSQAHLVNRSTWRSGMVSGRSAIEVRVFARFYRAVSTRTLPGSGLGLPIVAQIVERHGGEIWVAQSEHGGADVGFRLPTI